VTTPNVLAAAQQLPNGASFHKCALQVNPHDYASTFRGKSGSSDENEYAQAIIEKANELGISVLAITSHNDVSGIPAFRSAAAGHNIHIFPGFELRSSEGVHVLCIYPQNTDDGQLERYLGEFGIRNTSPSSDLANQDFVTILGRVVEQGGMSIAAHASNANGLFKVLNGKPLIQAWQSKELLAIQIPGLVEDLPQEVRQIVENNNVDYIRSNPVQEQLAVAVVNAKDVAEAEDLAAPSSTCWVKMSEVSIEGFRQAFLDPGSRIRHNPKVGELESDEHTEIVALTWEGGFLDGAMIHFNPNLNVLVGGRGTGKSTVIESIRSVLALDTLGKDAASAHAGIVQHVLKSGTKISLLVRAQRPSPRDYRIERTIPNPPIVRDAQGQVSNLSPQDVLPRIEIYGQHEISELSKSREKLTRLLDRFVERDESLIRRKSDLRRDLEKNRRSLIDVRTELHHIEDRLAALPGLVETLERFREAGLEERLQEQSLLVREERVLTSIPERLDPIREYVDGLKQEMPIDRAFLSAKALEDLPGKEILARSDEILIQLDVDLKRIVAELEKALQRVDQGVAAVRNEWEARKTEVQAAYEKILRELQKSRVDGEEFIRLRRQIEELRPLRERQTLVLRVEKERSDNRRALLAEWEDIKADEFRRLAGASEHVSRQLRDKVQVEVVAAGDLEPLFSTLREEIGGRLSEAIDSLERRPTISLTELVEACRAGTDVLSREFDIPRSQADRIANADSEVLMRIEELDLPPTTAIHLNTATIGERPTWQTLEELSTGQKATAVLLLLLLESDAPLIVDQPEDDLDNRFITEGVVPRMREEKQRRQFIFSTHNANIPVLGDAELIVGLTASGEADRGLGRIAPEQMGSIDSRPVRLLVEEILEGGKEAFEMRRRKYGF